MKNPYLEQTENVKNLSDLYNQNVDEIKKLEAKNKIYQKIMNSLRQSCTHKDVNNLYDVISLGQDPGSGKSESVCRICGRDC